MTAFPHGQIAITTSAQRLTALQIECHAFTIKAATANAASVYIGALGVTTSTGYELAAGETFEYERNVSIGGTPYTLSPQDFYVIGSNGDHVSWLASP